MEKGHGKELSFMKRYDDGNGGGGRDGDGWKLRLQNWWTGRNGIKIYNVRYIRCVLRVCSLQVFVFAMFFMLNFYLSFNGTRLQYTNHTVIIIFTLSLGMCIVSLSLMLRLC